MKEYQHIIWDWNGTLLDDSWLCIEIMNNCLAQHQLPLLTPTRYSQIFDFPVRKYYRRLGYDFNQTPFEQLSDAFMAAYHQRWLECHLRKGAVEILCCLQDGGLQQSVISAAENSLVNAMVGHYGLLGHFTAVRGLDDHHAHGKLELGRQWLAELELPPGDILMIGDTLHDAELARQLGIDCLLLVSGHHSRVRLEAAGVPVYNSLAEIKLCR